MEKIREIPKKRKTTSSVEIPEHKKVKRELKYPPLTNDNLAALPKEVIKQALKKANDLYKDAEAQLRQTSTLPQTQRRQDILTWYEGIRDTLSDLHEGRSIKEIQSLIENTDIDSSREIQNILGDIHFKPLLERIQQQGQKEETRLGELLTKADSILEYWEGQRNHTFENEIEENAGDAFKFQQFLHDIVSSIRQGDTHQTLITYLDNKPIITKDIQDCLTPQGDSIYRIRKTFQQIWKNFETESPIPTEKESQPSIIELETTSPIPSDLLDNQQVPTGSTNTATVSSSTIEHTEEFDNTEALNTRKKASREIDKIDKNISNERRKKTEEIKQVYSRLIPHGSIHEGENRAALDKITRLSQEYKDFQFKITDTEKNNTVHTRDYCNKLIEIVKAANDYREQLKHSFNTEQQILNEKQKELLTLKSQKDSHITSIKQLSTSMDKKTYQLDTLEISSILLRPLLAGPSSVSTKLSPETILASQQQRNQTKETLESERISLEKKISELQTELSLVREKITHSKEIIGNKTKIVNQLKIQEEIPRSILNQVYKTVDQISQDYPQIREVYAYRDNTALLAGSYDIKELIKSIDDAVRRKLSIQYKLADEGFENIQVDDTDMINILQNTKNTNTITYIYKNYFCSGEGYITSKLSYTEDKLTSLINNIKESYTRKTPIKTLNKDLHKEFREKGLNNTDMVKCLRLCKESVDYIPITQLFKYWKPEKSPKSDLTS